MGVTDSLLVELEQLPKIVTGEMTLSILGRIDYTSGQVLLRTPGHNRTDEQKMRLRLSKGHLLSLEDLLLDGACSLETIYETLFLLPISPHSRQSLLVACTGVQ